MTKHHDYTIVLNDYGYHEVSPMPDKAALNAHYRDKYFQDDNVIYQKSYEQNELDYMNITLERKYVFLQKTTGVSVEKNARVLEIGLGEGYAMQFLSDKGHDVLGVDFSDFAVKQHNPEMADKVVVEDPDSAVVRFIEEGRQFDLIWLDNVLEHSPTPDSLLKSLHALAAPGATIFIEVPNDYSMLQMEIKKRGMIKTDYWEAPPEHLSYFNIDALNKLAADCGWACQRAISDFPIDIFLLNEKSNYNLDPSVGKAAHNARMVFETMIDQQDTGKIFDFGEAMLNIGLGREISAVFVKA